MPCSKTTAWANRSHCKSSPQPISQATSRIWQCCPHKRHNIGGIMGSQSNVLAAKPRQCVVGSGSLQERPERLFWDAVKVKSKFQQTNQDIEDARTKGHLFKNKSAGMNWNKPKRETICTAADGTRGMGLHNGLGAHKSLS